MQANMKTIMAQGKKALQSAPRQMAPANQNVPLPYTVPNAPQWYDIKQMVEIMFDARARVRDAIADRRNAEMVRVHYNGHPSRQLITAEIHGLNMEISMAWHMYRQASAAYHMAWAVYQENLKR